MTQTDTARGSFLARADEHAPGQGPRFAPPLDDLLRWSREQGLEPCQRAGSPAAVRYGRTGGGLPVWAAAARAGDGGKLTVLAGPGFPADLQDEVRVELARIDGRAADPDRPPEVAFAKLIWPPHRAAVLDLLARVMDRLARRDTRV